jgi:hypothetical protein
VKDTKVSRVVQRMMTVAFLWAVIFGRVSMGHEQYKAMMDVMYMLWGGLSLAYLLDALIEWLIAGSNQRRREKWERQERERKAREAERLARASEIHRYYFGRTNDD